MRAAIYSRVSTHDQQTLDLQMEKCLEYASSRSWEVLFQVKEVGSGASKRIKREELLELCRRREVDVVIVWKLDRWGRSVPDIISTLQEMEELGVKFVSITEALDFTTSMGRAMVGLLAVFSEFEREMISERVKAGVHRAKLKGKTLGRPSKINGLADEIKYLWEKHRNKSLIANELGISRRSVSRAILDNI